MSSHKLPSVPIGEKWKLGGTAAAGRATIRLPPLISESGSARLNGNAASKAQGKGGEFDGYLGKLA
jgi:hypothetical protein